MEDRADAKCRCGKGSVILRKYEGRALCRSHFIKSVEDRIKRTVRQERMLNSGDRVAVALSGGKNSSLVLKILSGIINPRKDMEILAITVDEGIKGYSRESGEKARKLCQELGVNHVTVSFNEEFGKTMDKMSGELKGLKSGVREPLTVCAIGRRMILNKTARKLGATKIATGHNLDSEAQAVMLNYLRGDLYRSARLGPVTDWSTKKSGGEKFIPRIKPLRMVPDSEVSMYAGFTKLTHNRKQCPLKSNMRDWISEFVKDMEKTYPGMRHNIIQTFDKLLPSIRAASKNTEPGIRECPVCGEPCSEKVCKACQLWRAGAKKRK